VALAAGALIARYFLVTGRVQGVGYRPFVYRLAHRLNLQGWVRNVTGSVEIHAEGTPSSLNTFALALIQQAPAISQPVLTKDAGAEPAGHDGFIVLPSKTGEANIHVPPDYFVCEDCLREMRDPGNRRYRYPFINCTQCGPRYTLIESLPYDRPRTSMKTFDLCPACASEYSNPLDRRFHAEPIACPTCGPRLSFTPSPLMGEGRGEGATDTYALLSPTPLPQGERGVINEAALAAATRLLREGRTVAVKGIGGYHLLCDAKNDEAIDRLRLRKHRPVKPLAVMFQADGKTLAEAVECNDAALAFLQSPRRPILLLPKKQDCNLSQQIAPGLNEIGCLLPYSPLHALLLNGFDGPLVATSGNLSGEPVITDNAEAQSRLAPIADAFLHHNRPIVRPADDPVYRVIAGSPRPLRLARGIAPVELELPHELPEPVLALGAHTKNSIALAWGKRVVISPHIGDLSSLKSLETLARVADDLQNLYQVKAARLLLDRHPGYGYRRYSRETGLPYFEIWHHHAHAAAAAWEFPEIKKWIVFAWDGVGLGEHGELWGGETFIGAPANWRRAATLRPFRLPGGEQAGREPWRSAAALLWETGHPATFAPELLHAAWLKGINAPVTHAAGRLFDAAAALTGICTHASFEGEGPMKLEAAAAHAGNADIIVLPLTHENNGLWQTSWSPLVPMLTDQTQSPVQRAACFHASVAHALLDQALCLRGQSRINDVGLTGGVFQNKLLTETAKNLLEQQGFRVHIPELIAVNDAGVCLGQVMEFLYADNTT
jgi:hydrogenase maturation protein HypF